MKIIVWFSVLMMVFFGYSCTSGKGDGIRYIFFLIGDGMGNGQVTGTQFYRAELDGRFVIFYRISSSKHDVHVLGI